MRRAARTAVAILTAAVGLSPVPAAGGVVWTGAEIIDAGPGNHAYGPQVAAGGGGAVAVFEQLSGSVWRVYGNRHDGSGWTGATAIDAGSGGDAEYPRVAADGIGGAVAVFRQDLGPDARIWASRWTGAAWTAPTTIDAGPGNDAAFPDVAADGSGGAVAIFEQLSGPVSRIWSNRWDGSAWGGATTVDAGPAHHAYDPRVAMNESGIAFAVFRQYDGASWRVYARRWDGTGWSAATAVDSGPGNNAESPRVAIDGAGVAVAVFGQKDGPDDRVYANRWNGSSWDGAVAVDGGPGEGADFPAVAVGEGGSAVAVFQRREGSDDRVCASRWDGVSWSGPSAVDAGPGNAAYTPQVGVDGQGRATAVFQQSDGVYYRIYANRWDGLSWEGARVIDAGGGDNAFDPQVAVSGEGWSVAVFRQFEADDSRVYANRAAPSRPRWIRDYNGDGTSDLAVFRPPSGLWVVRGFTRLYFGGSVDSPVPADYDGDATTDPAVFRSSSGLWAVRGITRLYFGGADDFPLPGDYCGNGTADPAIFRAASGLWAVRGLTRVYFGSSSDLPVPGYYRGGAAEPAVFRAASGLWAIRGLTRVYYGSSADLPVPGDYAGDGNWAPAVFRPASGLWTIRGLSRVYFGASADRPLPGGYAGDGTDLIGIRREASGLWALKGETRVYFGAAGDLPVVR